MPRDDISKIILEFRNRYCRFFPKKATLLGNHDYDHILGKWDREGVRVLVPYK
jgi:hypothetical protein